MRWIKYTFIGLTSLVIAAVVIPLILVLLLDTNQLRDGFVHIVNRTSDNQLQINGPLALDLSLSPSVRVSDIHFKNTTDDFEFSAADLSLQIDLLSFRTNYLIINEILIKDGLVSARQIPDEGKEADDDIVKLKVPFVEKLDIENLVIHYLLPGESEPLDIRLASLKKDDPAGAETVVLTGNGTIDGIAFKLEGESGTAANLLETGQPFTFKYQFDVMQATIHAEGKISNPRETADLDIELQVEAPDLQGLLELLHTTGPDIALSATGRLAGTLAAPRLDDFELKLSKDKVALLMSGSVGNLITAEDIQLEFSSDITDTETLALLLPEQSPHFNNLKTAGKFSGASGDLLLSDYTLDASGPRGLRLDVEGSTRIVEAHQPLRELKATVTLASPDTEFVRQFTDAVPVIGPVSGTARVSMDSDTLVITGIKLMGGDKDTVHVEWQGDIGQITFTPTVDASKIDLNIILSGASARSISDQIHISWPNVIDGDWPDVGPVKLNGRYSGSLGSSSINDLHLQAGGPEQLQIDARGHINLAALDGDKPITGLELDVNLQAPSTTFLTAVTGTDVPAFGSVTGVVHVGNINGITAIKDLDLTVEKGKDFKFTLNGSVSDLFKREGIDMKTDLFASDLNTIGQLFDKALPSEGAVKYSGRARGSMENLHYYGRANLRNTTMGTELTASFAGKRPRVTGSITIPDLDLHDIGIYPEKRQLSADTSTPRDFDDVASQQAVVAEEVFSKEPIDFSGLQAIDLDLEFSVNKLSSTAKAISDIYSHIFLKDGKLDIKPLKYSVDNDVLSNDVMINSSTKPPTMSLQVSGDDIDLGLLLASSASKTSPVKGTMTARADLTSRGQSPAELAANLDGKLNFVAENAKIEKSAMNLLTVDVIGWAISNVLSPNKDVNIDCSIFIMHFNKGMGATDLHIIDTPDTLIKIDAKVNLIDQTMDVTILPEHKVRLFKTKKDPMRIYGPIANPQYKLVSAKDLAQETGRAWLLAPLTISTSLMDNITGLIVKPEETTPGSCDKFLK